MKVCGAKRVGRSPAIRGKFSISDLLREAAERSIEMTVAEATPHLDTPTMSGMIMAEEVQPGLMISGFDLTYLADQRVEMPVERSVLCAVLLDGVGQALEVENHSPFLHERGRVGIVGFGESRRCARPWYKGQRARVFGVTLRPQFFDRFGEIMADDDLAGLRSYLEPGVHTAVLPWSPSLVELAEAALNAPYGGSLRMLFRESQSLRFTLEITSLLREEEQLIRRIGRRPLERASEAREILDRTLANPPKVLDLSRRLGANVSTLQANFKAAFGTTIFGYVRRRRLEMARILLLDHGLGVAETGYRVGFTNPSAFTAAYRRHFGRPPSAETGAPARAAEDTRIGRRPPP